MSDRFIFNISFMNVNVPTPEPHIVPVLAKDKEDAEDKLRKSLNSNINILDIEQEDEFRERKTTSQLLDRHRIMELEKQNKKLEDMLHNSLSRICAASTFNSHTAIERLIDKETADWYWHYKSREDKK